MKTTHPVKFLGVLLLCGCAHVDPEPEYTQAEELITASTGHEVVVDPDAVLPTPEAVDTVLEDGLELEEAIELALRLDPRLRATFTEIGVATADWVQAGLPQNPVLNLFMRFPSGGGGMGIEGSLTQELLDLWKMPVREELARSRLDAVILDIAWQVSQTIFEVRAAYYGAVAADESLVMSQESLKLLESSLEGVRAQREVGAATLFDENLFRGQVLAAQLDHRTARLAAADARRHLAHRLGVQRSAAEWTFSSPLPQPEESPPDPEELVELALTGRLDVRAMESRVQEADANERLEQKERFPSLSLGGGFERHARPSGSGDRDPSVGGPVISAVLPIFDQNQAGVARAQFLRTGTERELEALQVAVAQEVRGAADHLESALENISLYRDELMDQATQNESFARDAFGLGQIDILTLLEAQRALLAVQRGDIDARLALALARARLEQSVGQPLE